MGMMVLPGYEEDVMEDIRMAPTVFVILVSTAEQHVCARLLIDSIRAFGGTLCHCPIWLFAADPQQVPCDDLQGPGVGIIPLAVPDEVKPNWFAAKVTACARAEELATPEVRSLIWLGTDCLILQAPRQLALGSAFDAAVRPVHIQNIGLGATEPLNGFWARVYEAVGVTDVPSTVQSFVDGQDIRAYYNSHIFSVNPSKGLFRQWYEQFAALVTDADFQSQYCQDDRHHIFLHQAVLSALIATTLDPERVRALPPDYSYPYNLHQQVPAGRRANALNDLVCIAYEKRSLNPAVVEDIEIQEPLRSWLSDRVAVNTC